MTQYVGPRRPSGAPALLLRVGLWLVVVAALSCKLAIPEGTIPCQEAAECPDGWFCSAQRCHSNRQPSLPDAGPDIDARTDENQQFLDSGVDSGVTQPAASDGGDLDSSSADTGVDAAPIDTMDCERSEVASDQGVFVSPAPGGSDANNCGGAEQPCATVTFGLYRARLLERALVYLDNGTYEEAVSLSAGVTLKGGLDHIGSKWTVHCGAKPEQLATIAAPGSVAVLAEYVGAAALERLTIRHQNTPAQPGQSRYGVFARGTDTQLTLRSVHVIAAHGGDGLPGSDGTPPAAPVETCVAGDGLAAGPAGEKGASGSSGVFSQDGFAAGQGQLGAPGAPGHNAEARTPVCSPCVESGSCSGSGLVCAGMPTGLRSCPTAGAPGCGGLPGTAGAGGLGGGASIALFAWQARVDVIDSLLESGNGGAGTLGGSGSSGGVTGAPGPGAPGDACLLCRRNRLIPIPTLPVQALTPQLPASASAAQQIPGTPIPIPGPGPTLPPLLGCTSVTEGAPAANGYMGTPGSAGGAGGDSAGGPTYAIYRGDGAQITQQQVQLAHGSGGASMGEGPKGAAAEVGE